MKKEKTIRTYQRRTKSGKVITVKQHTAKYDAAEEALKEAAKKKGAGNELEALKKKSTPTDSIGFTPDEYKEWYHWDMIDDPKNPTCLKVEKALKKQMGTKAYNKYLDDMSDNYSARGHNKALKALLAEHTERMRKQDAEIAKAAKDLGMTKTPKSKISDNKKQRIDKLSVKTEGKFIPMGEGDNDKGFADLAAKHLNSKSLVSKESTPKSKPSNRYGGMTKEEYEKILPNFHKRVQDAEKGTRAKYSFTDIKKKIKEADISEATKKRLLKSIDRPFAVVTPAVMERRLQRELDKKRSMI